MRRLVESMNSSKALSVKGAWEAVQHSACAQLADELRSTASQTLRSLASGQEIPGGAKLPMPDETLRTVLRDQRHVLKTQWDDRAIGDEAVRKEYWQELKETLAREEQSVRQSSSRLADQQLMEALRLWQEWLDDDKGDALAGERLANDLGQLMERMPVAPLSRAGRAAMEAAARRVAAARAAVATTVERSTEAQRRAAALGQQAAQQEGAARSELDTTQAEVQATLEKLRRVQHAERTGKMELQARVAELHDVNQQLSAALGDVEEARVREAELRAQQRAHGERETSLQSELEDARVSSSRAEAERMASERDAREAAGAAAAEVQRLEAELQAAREEVARCADRLASERAVLKSETEQTRTEHVQMVEDVRRQLDAERSNLEGEHERTRAEHSQMVEEARRQLEEDRRRNADALSAEQSRLLEKERNAGVLEGQVETLSNEKTSLHARIDELQIRLREAEVKAGRQGQEGERLKAELDRASQATEKARAELERELREQKLDYEARLEEELERRRKTKLPCMKFRTSKA